jgi:hypothetical protein
MGEFESIISLSDLGGYDGAPARGIARRISDAGPILDRLISDLDDFEQGAAWLGD